ncbi:hypothetical protein EG68_09779 [Paragonimus skrjabini miyazakii]|uniref:Uncharacterized protein n=1 Tax=Paragonimus skrjabini miyazakii TaxID=59628 RepID=A0A8S9YIN1_9TREM|nr:hypothetical protein EG68_09779 [Paragonimus skrjabini miyazakii]
MSTANRLSSIQELLSPDDRRYVDIKRNPAGLASRGMRPKDQRTAVWFNGWKLLWKDPVAWTTQLEDFSGRLTERRPEKQTQVLTTLGSVSWFHCFLLPRAITIY